MEFGKSRLLVFSYATTNAGIPSDWAAHKNRAGINLLEELAPTTTDQVIAGIKAHKKETDRVLLSIHWGNNWGDQIPKSQRLFAHSLIDSGVVDLIHGHSSHHPKGIEVHNGHLILYGCGDLINDYEGISNYEEFRDDLSLLYFPKLDSSGSLLSLTMAPMHIRQFRLNYVNNKDNQWLFDRLNKECQKLNTSLRQTTDGTYTLSW